MIVNLPDEVVEGLRQIAKSDASHLAENTYEAGYYNGGAAMAEDILRYIDGKE